MTSFPEILFVLRTPFLMHAEGLSLFIAPAVSSLTSPSSCPAFFESPQFDSGLTPVRLHSGYPPVR